MSIAPDDHADEPAAEQDDGQTVPELLAAAAGLGASLSLQVDAFGEQLFKQMPALPGLPQAAPPPDTDQELDLPKMIERLQGEMAQAVSQLSGLASGFGVEVPAGVGADELLALLGAAAQAQLGQHAAALGQAPAPPAIPLPPDGLPDLGELVKTSQAEHAAALTAMAELFKTHGIDPADPMGALARMMPELPAAPTAPPAGFPDAFAALQGDAARLKQLTDELFAKLIPR